MDMCALQDFDYFDKIADDIRYTITTEVKFSYAATLIAALV